MFVTVEMLIDYNITIPILALMIKLVNALLILLTLNLYFLFNMARNLIMSDGYVMSTVHSLEFISTKCMKANKKLINQTTNLHVVQNCFIDKSATFNTQIDLFFFCL